MLSLYFRFKGLTVYQKKKLIEKVREKEKKRMTGEYYDIQLRWDLNPGLPAWEENAMSTMKTLNLKKRKLYDLGNRNMIQSYLIHYLTLRWNGKRFFYA